MNPDWKFRILVVVTIAIGGFAGFGGDAVAGALPKDPCALLTPAEIHTLAPDVKIGSGVLDASGAPMAVSCSYNWGPKTREWGDSGITIIVTDAEKIWPGRLSPDDVRQRVEI